MVKSSGCIGRGEASARRASSRAPSPRADPLSAAAQGYVEGGAAAGLALHPCAPAVRLGDLAHDGEPDPGAAAPVLACAEALEDLEDALVVLARDAPAVVPHADAVEVRLLDH